MKSSFSLHACVCVCVCVHKVNTHSLCSFMYIQWDLAFLLYTKIQDTCVYYIHYYVFAPFDVCMYCRYFNSYCIFYAIVTKLRTTSPSVYSGICFKKKLSKVSNQKDSPLFNFEVHAIIL